MSLRFSQQLVWDRLEDNLRQVGQANVRIEARATVIATSASAIIGLVSASKFLPGPGSGTVTNVLLGLMGLAALAVVWLGTRILIPKTLPMAGSMDTDILWDEYLSKEDDIAFNNALIDLTQAMRESIKDNHHRGDSLEHMLWAFRVQLGLLAATFLWMAWCAFRS